MAQVRGTTSTVPIDSIEPNPWNPNVMSEWKSEKEQASIKKFGFIDPITVRSAREKGPAFPKKQIIDGEQRWRAALALGMTEVLILDIGRISDAQAATLTDVLNNLRGENDPERWTKMVDVIRTKEPNLLSLLPYRDHELKSLLQPPEPLQSKGDPDPVEAKPTGKLYKKFQVSLPEPVMVHAQDLVRQIKAAYKVDSDAAAFKVMLDLVDQGMASRRSVPPPAPSTIRPPPPAPPRDLRRTRRRVAAT